MKKFLVSMVMMFAAMILTSCGETEATMNVEPEIIRGEVITGETIYVEPFYHDEDEVTSVIGTEATTEVSTTVTEVTTTDTYRFEYNLMYSDINIDEINACIECAEAFNISSKPLIKVMVIEYMLDESLIDFPEYIRSRTMREKIEDFPPISEEELVKSFFDPGFKNVIEKMIEDINWDIIPN